jgi:hypothetical protein
MPLAAASARYGRTATQGPSGWRTKSLRPLRSVIEDDDTGWTDCETVETLAIKKADRAMLPIAQVMLAVRGWTWKPVQ